MNNVFVGEDIILPRSPRSPPHRLLLSKQKISISSVGVDVLDDPRNMGITAVHPSVILPDCRGDHQSSEVATVIKCTSVCCLSLL